MLVACRLNVYVLQTYVREIVLPLTVGDLVIKRGGMESH
jgi:hypothetical protein